MEAIRPRRSIQKSSRERIPHLLCRSQKMSDLLKNPIIESPTQIFSWFERIQAPNKQAKYFRIKFRFHRDIRSVSSKMLTPQCALHLWIKILGLLNPNFLYLEFFSPIMDVLTSKRILPDCSFQSNQILYQQIVWFWLRGKQFDSRAPRSLTLRWDAHPAEFLKDVSLTFEYIGEIQTEFENTQARLWGAGGARWVRIMKKSRGRKFRDTLP